MLSLSNAQARYKGVVHVYIRMSRLLRPEVVSKALCPRVGNETPKTPLQNGYRRWRVGEPQPLDAQEEGH